MATEQIRTSDGPNRGELARQITQLPAKRKGHFQ